MRERSRVRPKYVALFDGTSSTFPTLDHPFYKLHPDDYVHVMTDVGNQPDSRRFKPCTSIKKLVSWRNMKKVDWNPTFDYVFEPACALSAAGWDVAMQQIITAALAQADIKQLNAEAYITMKPTLKTDLSLSNFLLEITSIKSLFKLWERGASKIKNVSSAHLNHQFGWKPLISDLKVMGGDLWNWRERLKDYKSRMGQPHTSHFYKNLGSLSGAFVLGSKYLSHYSYEIKDIHFNATMKYIYTVPKINSEYVDVRAVLDSAGLKFTPAVVWEAIPFSFAADWFLGIGPYLESRETDYLDSVVYIVDYCWSVRFDAFIEVGASCPEYGCTTPFEHLRAQLRYYDRKIGTPNANDFGITEAGKYGTKQTVLSAALLGSRRR
jgi:hypothetical protein